MDGLPHCGRFNGFDEIPAVVIHTGSSRVVGDDVTGGDYGLTDCHKLAAVGKSATTATVVRLLLWIGPTAILWGIAQRIVPTLDRRPLERLLPHIGKKCREIISPFFANRNAATAVVGIVGTIGVEASLAHVHPCRVLGRVGVSMLESAGAGFFGAQTSAGFSAASTKQESQTADRFDIPAIALANPGSMTPIELEVRYA